MTNRILPVALGPFSFSYRKDRGSTAVPHGPAGLPVLAASSCNLPLASPVSCAVMQCDYLGHHGRQPLYSCPVLDPWHLQLAPIRVACTTALHNRPLTAAAAAAAPGSCLQGHGGRLQYSHSAARLPVWSDGVASVHSDMRLYASQCGWVRHAGCGPLVAGCIATQMDQLLQIR